MTDLRVKMFYLLKKLMYRYRYGSILYGTQSGFQFRCILFSINYVVFDFESLYNDFLKLDNKRKAVKKRAKKYIVNMFAGKNKLFFVTLTFNDDYINLKDTVKHKYVLSWCNKNCFDYYGNVDYGSETYRYHCHIIADMRLPYDMWNYGFMNVKPIRKSNKSMNRLNSYIHKLLNHSVKFTCGKSFHPRIGKHLVEVYDLSVFD